MDLIGVRADIRAALADNRPVVALRRVLTCAAGDLGWAIATGADGATTVSATVFAAARAGIDVVATGGIGGVHRGDTGDVSVVAMRILRTIPTLC